LFGRRGYDRELDDEFETHIALLTERFVNQGMTQDQAHFAATRQFGRTTQVRETLRDSRGWPTLETFWQDIRYAFRQLRKSPGFALAAFITLALGIGANSVVFTIVNTAFLRPLPVDRPEQLVFFNRSGAVNLSYPNYVDFRDRNDVLSGLAGCRFVPANLSVSAGNSSRAWAYEATGNYFDTLGVKPLLGRLFTAADDTVRGGNPVAVLSYRAWQQRFGGDPGIPGRNVKINGLDFIILGVTPREFYGTERIVLPDLWVPMSMEAQMEPGNEWLDWRGSTQIWVIGRLKLGVSIGQAEGSLNRVAAQLAHDYPAENSGMTIHLSPPGLVGEGLRRPVVAFATVLMGVAGLVLLLASLNLAGLLLARASDRRREVALRLALGAKRIRVVRQLLTESLVIALAGGAASVALAFWVARLCASLDLPFDIPANTLLAVDGRVMLFTFAVALIATVLFGAAPALQTVRVDLIPALKNESVIGRRFRHWHLRDAVVGLQIALSCVLLIASVMVVRSLEHAVDLNLGFNADGAVSVSFDLGLQGYSETRGRAFQQAVLEKASALPGIQAAGITSNVPLRLGTDNRSVFAAGKPRPPRDENSDGNYYTVTPGYFAAAGTRLMAGRDIDWRDREGAPRVAVVNSRVAESLFPGENAVGKRIQFGKDSPAVEIVGIVENGKYQSLGEDPGLAVFVPLAQDYKAWTTLVVRTHIRPAEATAALRRLVAEMDPSMPLFNTGSLRDNLALALFPARVAGAVLGSFGLIAVMLAGTGVFSVVAYAVARRTREIGIRMALGASVGAILQDVLARTGVLLIGGIVAGFAIAVATGRGLSAVLYGVGPNDPPTYIIVLILMAAIGAVSCWVPARRAMHIEPSRSLREE
jgi:predicted permease